VKKTLLISFGLHSLFVFSQVVPTPTSNIESGIFTTDISLELFSLEPGSSVFYTLNGNVPTTGDALYTGPIVLGNRNGDPNNQSMIPTNPSFTYPVGDYTAARADSRGWLPPYSEVYKINVVRFRAFKPGFAPSETVTRTFMIDPSGAALYSMPVVSVVIDSMDLFSDASGYYVYGPLDAVANYSEMGTGWEREAHLEIFDQTGTLDYRQTVRSRIHGGGSRHSPKKNIRLYGDSGAISSFDYPFFTTTEQASHKRILLKAGGHRPDCFPRDDMANLMTTGLNVEQQHTRHVILFVNGEYWGIQSFKERMDKYFFQNATGIDDDQITVLDQEYDVQDGYSADSLEMNMLEDFVTFNDMTMPINYQYVKDRVDVDNYIDYMCSEIFLSNEDWVYSNVVMWRKTGAYVPGAGAGHDGKFRWALYDLDGAFGGSCSEAYYTVNTLDAATVTSGTFASYTRFFRGLLENDDFRTAFIQRMSDLLNSWFRQNALEDHLNSTHAALTPEMQENTERWRYHSVADNLLDRSTEIPSLTQWDYLFDEFQTFVERRQRKIRDHVMLKWSFNDTSDVMVDVNDLAMGRVQVNTILINENLPGTNAGIYPWTGIYIDSIPVQLVAVPLPGYEFVEWLESGNTDDTISWMPNSDSTFTAVFQISPVYTPVLVNETALTNSSYYADNFDNFDDWSELFNPNAYAVNLSGCKLKNGLQEWTLPNGTIIDAGAYLLFWHDGETYQGSNHITFKLPNVTDTLFLLQPDGTLIDELKFFATAVDHSYGRFPNGSGTFIEFNNPTPLMNNDFTTVPNIETILNPLIAYPNPGTGFIHLNKTVDYVLSDFNGRIVRTELKSNVIQSHGLAEGIYLLQSSEKEFIKIVVLK